MMAVNTDVEPEDDREYIECSFHVNEPIRAKPVRPEPHFPPIVIPFKRQLISINERFNMLMDIAMKDGIVYDEDADADDDVNGDENGMEKEDAEYDVEKEDPLVAENVRRVKMRMALRLKNKAIANRLGVRYEPRKRHLNQKSHTHDGIFNCNRITLREWVHRYGSRLAAKKLLYLPLLFRKYKSGPKKSKRELDIEIDIYMADVRKKGKKFNLADITNDHVVDVSYKLKTLFEGFGGPKWKKRLGIKEKPNKENSEQIKELNADIDDYNANSKAALDTDLDHYWAEFRTKFANN